MNLMLAFIFACVALGVLARRLGPREHAVVLVLALGLTALYYFFSARFM